MRLSTNISQNLSLQLSTSLALDKGVKEIHEIVKGHEKELKAKQFIKDVLSFLVKANKKSFFTPRQDDNVFLKADVPLTEMVIGYAAQRHNGEYRDSGNPYIAHVLSTGFLLARLGLPRDVILSGILHDAVEDNPNKNKVLNDLWALSPAIAWNVYSVSGPDIKDAVEKDKILYKRLDSMAGNSGNIFPKVIKCADGIANLYDIEFLKPKDGRTSIERQRLFVENIRIKILPYAREIDQSKLLPLRKRDEIFSLEEYMLETLEAREIHDL